MTEPEAHTIGRALSNETVQRLSAELGRSGEAVRRMPERRLMRSLAKLEFRDRPRLRVEFERDALCGDGGAMPDEGTARALAQLDGLRKAASSVSSEVAGMPAGAALFEVHARVLGPTVGLNANNTGWTPLGPGNIGGRTRALVIDPTDTTRILAAGVGGGVWRSVDSGNSWDPTHDLMANPQSVRWQWTRITRT